MNSWLPPYRLCVLRSDPNLVQSIQAAVNNNINWEVLYVDSVWECALYTINCGVNVIYVNDRQNSTDINLDFYSEMRFFACHKLPIPFIFVRSSVEETNASETLPYPFSKKIPAVGIVSRLKSELENVVTTKSNKGSQWGIYSDLQFAAFVQGKFEEPGAILNEIIPEHFMIQPKIWPYFFNDKYAESEKILEPLLKRFPYNPFINTLSAISFYTQKKIVQARERLDQVINEGSGNPIMIYLVFVITDQFHDFNYQCALAEVLTKKFPYSYPTMVASAIWNCRMGNFEQGISQLFGCIDKIPQDLVAAGMLMRMLKSKGYDSLSGAVREYMSSAMLKSTIYHHMFSNLFGIKEK